MKVLLVNNLHRRRGGADIVYFNTAELLRQAGHEVYFFSFSTEDMEPCSESSFFAPSQDKVPVLQRMRNYCFNKTAADKLQSLIDKIHPDIAHVHLIWGGLSPSVLVTLKKNHIPVVHSVHDYRMVCPAYTFRSIDGQICEKCKGGKYYNCAIKRCSKGKLLESLLMAYEMYHRERKYNAYKLIDGFIFVSEFAKNKHEEFNAAFSTVPSIVLYNFWSGEAHVEPHRADLYSSYYLYYGRLSREKGVNTLIAAFEKTPELNLKIVGEGPEKEVLHEACEARGIRNVGFLGYQSGETLFSIVRNAKFVCVPSEWYENNPMTIVESYALGTPVIGARIGGIPEIVENGETGLVFEAGNTQSLVDILHQSAGLNDAQYYKMREGAERFALAYFSKTTHLQKLVQFYQRVINSAD